MARYIMAENKEYDISRQVLRSGTSIGANIAEAVVSFSKSDFAFKMDIALKEANETSYWLHIINGIGLITDEQYVSLESDCNELISILVSINKTTQNNLKKENVKKQVKTE